MHSAAQKALGFGQRLWTIHGQFIEPARRCRNECFTTSSDGALEYDYTMKCDDPVQDLGIVDTILLHHARYTFIWDVRPFRLVNSKRREASFEYREERHGMVSHPGGTPIKDVDRINNVLLVSVFDGISSNAFREFGPLKEVVMPIVNGDWHEHNMVLSTEAC